MFMRQCMFEIGWDDKNPIRNPGFGKAFAICLSTIIRDIRIFCSKNKIENYEITNAMFDMPIDGCDHMVVLQVEITHDNDNCKAI